jgi:hypothetical protein
MTTLVPDFVKTNLGPFEIQKDLSPSGYRTINQINEERNIFPSAAKLKSQPLNSKEKEDFPYKHVLKGIQELGPFGKVFFSKKNMEWLHKNIRYGVYVKSVDKTVISTQRDMDLLESMRRIYLQKSNNPKNIEDIKNELIRINTLVLQDIIPRILSEITQYKLYLRDIQQDKKINTLPVNVSVIGTKLEDRGPADVLGLYN